MEAQRAARSIEGVDPAYVFKIRALGPLKESALGTSGLQFLGDTTAWTYFVLAPGDEPALLEANLAAYTAAGRDRSNAPQRSLFESIDEFLPYDRTDRRGPGVPEDGDEAGAPWVVDVIVWPSPDGATARARIGDVQTVISLHGATILGADERARYSVVRARVGRQCLDDLLDLTVVERIRRPPTPRLEPSDWRNADVETLPTASLEPMAPVGLIDDGVMDHPLLPSEVVVSRSAIPAGHSWQPASDHGTLVAGILAYDDLEGALAGEVPWVAHAPIHSVRVLEPDPRDASRTRFPTDLPVHMVVEQAIRQLHDEHHVRVFNLSIADDSPYSGPHVSTWTESLDDLARELDIVIVVAAGNHTPRDLPPGTDLCSAYPGFLLADDARVAEPGVAANVLTVGSIAHSDAPQTITGTSRPGDRAVAEVGQASPFTRTGPGVAGATKPDVVERGGNWVLNDLGTRRDRDYGVSVLSLARRDGQLFGIANGTSFAAPRVARIAAQVLKRYPGASANLVRALIGAAALPITRSAGLDDDDLRRVAGYGRPIASRVMESGARRVAMTFEGSLDADTAVIHPVPIPPEFARGATARTITVALAFDPDVRRTRREYLSSHMSFDLVRAMTLDDIRETWQRQPAEREARRALPRDRRRPTLVPGQQASNDSTLQVRSLRTSRLDVDDGETYYVVLRHISSPWLVQAERYALVVTLEDEARQDIDLYASLQLLLPTRVRLQP
ncbi:S8 family peptidase [Miltoncostaea oceani]|uniref:S8 family peptidase n=1 Tax=Miltoncostaea oceani TaxID=2843216 RepID=UPI001C3E4596|nr:S8 family peptidase [Miltoncostaea oceani]